MNKEQRDWLAMMALDELDVGAIDRRAIQAAVDLWDRLPKTADGVAAVPQVDSVHGWHAYSKAKIVEEFEVADAQPYADVDWNMAAIDEVSRFYSTREAALASKGDTP